MRKPGREGRSAMEIKEKIKALKEEQDAVILAHYYVSDEVQALFI